MYHFAAPVKTTDVVDDQTRNYLATKEQHASLRVSFFKLTQGKYDWSKPCCHLTKHGQNHDSPWSTMSYHVSSQTLLILLNGTLISDHGSSWSVMVIHDQSCLFTVYHGQLWWISSGQCPSHTVMHVFCKLMGSYRWQYRDDLFHQLS